MTSRGQDSVVRAMSVDGAFRVIVAVTTETVAEASATQGASGEMARRLGELITGAVLLRETVLPQRRVQAILKDAAGGQIVADSRPDGTSRGLINPGVDEDVDLSTDALLQVNYTLASGDLHQAMVGVPATGTISEALMRYMQESEQIVSTISVLSLPGTDNGLPRAVGGFVVQLLPEAEREALAQTTAHLSDFDALERALAGPAPAPMSIVAELFAGQEYSILAESALSFGCNCSRERMIVGLASLPKSEISELIDEGEGIEVSCDACGEKYRISLSDLGAILMANVPGKTGAGRN